MANTDEAEINPSIPNGADRAARGATVGDDTPDTGPQPDRGEGDEQEPGRGPTARTAGAFRPMPSAAQAP